MVAGVGVRFDEYKKCPSEGHGLGLGEGLGLG